MRVFLGLSLCLLAASSFAKEDCSYEAIGLNEKSSEIEKYFYTGTCHYRNEDYSLSVANWEKLANLDISSEEDEELKINVLNNLGYMKFFGYGTEVDKETAVRYWREAIALGHYEAEYHLCHAYADLAEPTYNPAKARKHCEKSQLIYKGKEDSDPVILKSINKYLRELSK
ncbi:SEL1-like repeat protein [Thalassolituus sp. C2-1]|uniref:SEL1-like repeat protein n=1 Tax=Venatorbacter sp. C2-1 TaxID=2597518 RepID=UPI001197793E|nr:SEL1-like repeat protein [Thalassolituus sp. C2-1]TVV39579.1 sel1 repeat family protein [Thalassolituus sp. C2-1]